MAYDRFVYWGERRPTYDEVVRVVRNVLGYAGTIEEKAGKKGLPWLVATLPGKPTLALDGIAKMATQCEMPKERWFEVFVHADSVDVLTRQQDEFTNAVADAVAETLKRYWAGSDESPTKTRSA